MLITDNQVFEEKHLILPDIHCPDHNVQALRSVYKFIDYFKPDFIHLLGDVINMTRLFARAQVPSERNRKITSIDEEINDTRSLLYVLVDRLKKTQKEVKIIYYEGNHESRLLRHLYRTQSEELAPLKVNDEYVFSIPHLLEFHKLGIKWLPKEEIYQINDNFRLHHGEIVRKHAGYTAKEMMDQTQISGVQGHTHRLGVHCHTYNGRTEVWMELGCLENIPPDPPYISKHKCNWQTGFGVLIHNRKTDQIYLTPILMQDHQTFMYGNRLFTPA